MFEHGWTLYAVLNVIFLVISVFVIITAIYESKLYKRKIQFILFGLCIIVLPFSCCIYYFVSPTVMYRPMMLLSIAVFYIWIAILIAKWFKLRLRNISIAILIGIVFNFGIEANIAYYLMERCYEATYATASEMLMRLHMMDEENVKKVAIVGNLASEVSWDTSEIGNRIHILAGGLEQNLLYDQQHTYLFLSNTFDFKYEIVSEKELLAIEDWDEVQAMNSWPAPDSVKIVDGIAVIKLSDMEECSGAIN